MPAPVEWPTRPVFISSTFKDMHAERGWLLSHVFPQLEEELKKRHHHLETIDLRLGVETVEEASEEACELKVLKVCLDEIERSRPFLIVLLGDRYGWVPPEERMERAAREAGFSTTVSGKSVTALEIEFGVVKKDPAQRRRSFFHLTIFQRRSRGPGDSDSPPAHGHDRPGFQIPPVSLQYLRHQCDARAGRYIGQAHNATVAPAFGEDDSSEVRVDGDQYPAVISGPAQDGGIARVGAALAGLDNVVPFGTQPVRETAAGTAIDEKLHLLAVSIASRESCAMTACAYARQARMSASSRSG